MEEPWDQELHPQPGAVIDGRAKSPRLKARTLHMLQGIVLSLGAPFGWLVLRLLGGSSFRHELVTSPFLYLYMFCGTTLVFGAFGWLLGRQQDYLRARNRALDELAVTDALTGLKNRRYFLSRLEQQCHLASRAQRSFALVSFDLDHFKRVNDQLGHAVGDRVLASFAELLRGRSRRSELPARLGGEEFVLLLPESSTEEGRLTAERLVGEVRASLSKLAGLPDGWIQTVSAGVAGAEVGSGLSAAELLQAADRALYRAKEDGRDRVSVAPLRRIRAELSDRRA